MLFIAVVLRLGELKEIPTGHWSRIHRRTANPNGWILAPQAYLRLQIHPLHPTAGRLFPITIRHTQRWKWFRVHLSPFVWHRWFECASKWNQLMLDGNHPIPFCALSIYHRFGHLFIGFFGLLGRPSSGVLDRRYWMLAESMHNIFLRHQYLYKSNK